ncbi:microfibril-associated glycoprotein 4-like isoform X1 [Diabrotica virgifera virgifera]|uniref:Microfibril-associated glycoprotein 4-like isoform X1 n=1 Tax=Diabrotica virgifera virgifera TaxID=50390 RepID=A0A6P7EXY4_DIAVI|nr:microfibril-associated glycoprotein 4-like isoform X1 [Diabrotica virgifera virgifera]
MISLLLVALVGVALSKNVVLFAGALKSENDPVNMKLTKLLDVKIESKSDYWKNDLSRLLQSQAEENSLGKNEEYVQVPLKLSFGIERTNNKDSGEEGMESIFQTCGSLVGRNQLPFCRFNPHKVQKLNSNSYPRSCREILESGKNQSGIYVIKPRTSSKPYSVLCDMESRGGGWTYIQNRFDGSQDFYLPWRDYKFGFGDLDGEFWMGLENIYHMTGFETNELLIELTDRDKKTAYAQYKSFAIGPEKDGYKLNTITGFSGDAGDAITPHLNYKFSTFDVDQDGHATANCAQVYEGGWWYTSGHASNLNGKHMNKPLSDAYKFHGLNWNGFRGHDYNLAGSKIMIRPVAE